MDMERPVLGAALLVTLDKLSEGLGDMVACVEGMVSTPPGIVLIATPP
jgi:hypothetical protein